MPTFIDLFRESVIIQGLIVLLLFALVGYLVATGQSVPNEVWGFLGLVVGYYFGSDKRAAIQRAFSAARKEG